MLSFWQSTQPCSRCRISCESNRRIFCIDPTKQRAALFRVGRYKCNTSRRRQKRYGRRVDNLQNIKAQGMRHQRQDQKSREHCRSPPGGRPTEKKWFGCNLRSDVTHRAGVAASATDVIPCSSAAFVTSATVLYETERSALIIIDWSLRLATSSNGAS